MQIDRHTQLFGGFEHRPEELVVEEPAVDVPVDQRADEAMIAYGALQFGRGGARVAHRQGGETEEPVRIRRDGADHRIVGLPGQFDSQRYLDGLDAGHVGQDLHVETGRIHRGDPLLPQVKDARRRPTATATRLVEDLAGAVGVRVDDGRQRVVLLERNGLHIAS
jgi:hypothetical protein